MRSFAFVLLLSLGLTVGAAEARAENPFAKYAGTFRLSFQSCESRSRHVDSCVRLPIADQLSIAPKEGGGFLIQFRGPELSRDQYDTDATPPPPNPYDWTRYEVDLSGTGQAAWYLISFGVGKSGARVVAKGVALETQPDGQLVVRVVQRRGAVHLTYKAVQLP